MDVDLLQTEITYLKGVGPRRAALLSSELDIHTFEDLLYYFPYRYEDRSRVYQIGDINSDAVAYQVKGKIKNIQSSGKGFKRRLSAMLYDDSGSIKLVWFQGVNRIVDFLKEGEEYLVYGKPNMYQGFFNLTHPEMELFNSDADKGLKLHPVYHSGEKLVKAGLHSKGISKLMLKLLPRVREHIYETLNSDILNRYRFVSLRQALEWIHFPPAVEQLEKARKRLKFEELFFIQLQLIAQRNRRHRRVGGHVFSKVGEHFNTFYHHHLPFELTNAQKRVVKEIRHDMGSPYQMNRLLQGDVGSGKTLVALLAMLIAIDNGYQAALMAPTEILATQHYHSLSNFLKGMNVSIALLTGSVSAAVRKPLYDDLREGRLDILIGTHALIEDKVKFKNLGFVVIDEQHRFGVAQRARLWAKNTIPPDVLVMTATPIPRTMAMSLYGDLDSSVIDELPKGRKPVQTFYYSESQRLKVFGFMRKLLAQGRQVYIVYPLIEESETLDLKNLMEGYEAVSRAFPLPHYRLGIVHGKMDSATKEEEMRKFVRGQTQILVSTTVIEVGVDVPNATLMIIENADRFGLSQLHQLRGRVGRGADQSYCFLMTEGKISKEAKIRLNAMVKSNDGFEIANMDLKLRGPGDLKGTRQSGLLDLKIADIVKDEAIMRYARKEAIKLLDEDPELSQTENAMIRKHLLSMKKNQFDWSKIS